MSDGTNPLADRYKAALNEHLAGGGEAALNQAYEIGRAALSEGLGLLELTVIHHQALDAVAQSASRSALRRSTNRAAEFFAESLSPFEMTLRGYREANAHLVSLNEVLRQAKASVEDANRELEAFSYSVAHDLRAPLRSIDGFSQALLEDYAEKLDAEGTQYLGYVRESAQQMARLIDDLLALSRVTRRELHREAVDLAELARHTAAQLRQRQPEREVIFEAPTRLAANGDPSLLRIVFENLLGNAWKFTGKVAQPKVEFGTTTSDAGVMYFVRDNGAGFDMAYAAKLFGVFQRLHAASEFEGTGIGLATVQRVVHRHGGRIWAEGAVDRGATFYFTLGDPAQAGGERR